MKNIVKEIILNKKNIDGTEADTLKKYLYQSHLVLRRAIGVLALVIAIGLPVVDYLLNHKVESSISAYYHTNARDVFVGILCVVGVFLMSYKSYNLLERLLAITLGILAVGIALVPTTPVGEPTYMEQVMGGVHTGLAIEFFLLFGILSRLIFRKTDVGTVDEETKRTIRIRNRVYDICNGVLLVDGVVCFVNCFMGFSNILIYESIALIAFGVAWIVKGKMIRKWISKAEYDEIKI